MPVIRCYIGEQVKPDREVNVARIEIYQMVSALGRYVIQQFLGQIAVRVNQSNTMPKFDVLQNQIAQQSSLTRTGLSDDVDVLALVNGRYAKRLRFSPAFAVSDQNVWFVRFQNQSPLPKVPVVSDFVRAADAGRMLRNRPAG